MKLVNTTFKGTLRIERDIITKVPAQVKNHEVLLTTQPAARMGLMVFPCPEDGFIYLISHTTDILITPQTPLAYSVERFSYETPSDPQHKNSPSPKRQVKKALSKARRGKQSFSPSLDSGDRK